MGCDTCDEGTWSHIGSATCDICDSGFFLHPADGCTECAGDFEGADCSRKGSTLERIVLKAGWWRTGIVSDNLLECASEEACVGGNRTDAYCAEGYSSYLCEVCSENFYAYGDFCLSCEEDPSTAIWVLVVLIVVILGGAGLLWWRHKRGKGTGNEKSNRSSQSALKIILAFCIILYSMEHVFNLVYPSAFEDFVNSVIIWLSLNFLSSFTGLECALETSFYDQLLLETLLPVLVTFLLAISVVAHQIITNRRIQSGGDLRGWSDTHKSFSDSCFTMFLWMTCKCH